MAYSPHTNDVFCSKKFIRVDLWSGYHDKSKGLTALYKTVNKAIDEGENECITIKKNKNGEDVWRLSPTPALDDPEESLFGGLSANLRFFR